MHHELYGFITSQSLMAPIDRTFIIHYFQINIHFGAMSPKIKTVLAHYHLCNLICCQTKQVFSKATDSVLDFQKNIREFGAQLSVGFVCRISKSTKVILVLKSRQDLGPEGLVYRGEMTTIALQNKHSCQTSLCGHSVLEQKSLLLWNCVHTCRIVYSAKAMPVNFPMQTRPQAPKSNCDFPRQSRPKSRRCF